MLKTLCVVLLVALCCQLGQTIPRRTRDDHQHEKKDWWEETVFYQIYPRSFVDSDGDGIGDIKGITSKLEHLKDAGIGATWLSPIFKSPMYDFGYDISDFYSIQPEYGTMADFEALLSKAKALDIKIIMDFVPNHASYENKWFTQSLDKNSTYADWFIWADGKLDENGNLGPPNNWVSVFRKSAWSYRRERRQYYLHQFARQQPDLNYRNPAVVEEMKNVLRFWLNKGIAGFRVDAVNHLMEVVTADGKYPNEPLTGYPDQGPDDYGYLDHVHTKDLEETYWMVYEWRKVFDEFTQKDNFTRVMMTEAYADINQTMLYYGNGTSEGAHMPFNFGLIENVNENSNATQLKEVVDKWMKNMPKNKTANWVIGNHDKWRVGTRYGVQRIDALNMLVLLLPGAAITYMGEEIGMVNTDISWEDTVDPQACNTDDPINYWKSSRDPARTPFQWNDQKNAGFSSGDKTWLPVNPNYKTLNLESQKAAARSHYKIYKSVSSMREIHTFEHGDYKSITPNDDVFAFGRTLPDHDTYVVAINMKNTTSTVNLTPLGGLAAQLRVMETSLDSPKRQGDNVTANALKMEPFESLVLMSAFVKPF